jgi:hypothetical protein
LLASNFPSGSFRCESSLLDLKVARDFKIASGEKGYIIENKQKKGNSKSVTGEIGSTIFVDIRGNTSIFASRSRLKTSNA